MNYLRTIFSVIGIVIFLLFYILAFMFTLFAVLLIDFYRLINKLLNGKTNDKGKDTDVEITSTEGYKQ